MQGISGATGYFTHLGVQGISGSTGSFDNIYVNNGIKFFNGTIQNTALLNIQQDIIIRETETIILDSSYNPLNNDNTNYYIASDSSGGNLALAVYGGGIYTSKDSGFTWNQTSAPTANWNSITSDDTGNYLTATIYGGNIYISQNGGISWFQPYSGITGVTGNWTSIVSTTDGSGQELIATSDTSVYTITTTTKPYYNMIYDSRSAIISPPLWTDSASYNGGTYFIDNYGKVFKGTNNYFDCSFVGLVDVSLNAQCYIACNSTGQHLAAAVCYGNIYYSDDYGSLWTNINKPGTTTQNWTSICIDYSTSQTDYYIVLTSILNIYQYNSGNNNGQGSWSVETPYPNFFGFTSSAISSINVTQNPLKINANLYATDLSGNFYYITVYNDSYIQSTSQITSISQTKNYITCNTLGTIIFAAVETRKIYKTNNTNQNFIWSSVSSISADWNSIACDSSGQYLAATINNGSIYYSNNTGTSLIYLNDSSNNWNSISYSSPYFIATTDSGEIFYFNPSSAVPSLNPYSITYKNLSDSVIYSTYKCYLIDRSGHIYSSSNITTEPFYYTSSLNLMTDASYSIVTNRIASGSIGIGNFLAIAVYGKGIYTSSNNQVFVNGNNFWNSIACDSSGQNILVTSSNGSTTYYSTTRGNSWNNTNRTFSFVTKALSYNAWYGITSTQIYKNYTYNSLSSNYWTEISNITLSNLSSIVCDSTGKYIYVTSSGSSGSIYQITTTDYSSFTEKDTNAPKANWSGIACDNSGNHVAAIANGKGIYISQTGNTTFSWELIPDTSSNNWTSISCDSSGQNFIATASNGVFKILGTQQSNLVNTYDISINTISGTNNKPFTCSATNSNGTNKYVVDSCGNVYYYYSTPTNKYNYLSNIYDISSNIVDASCCITCDSTGQYLAVGTYGGGIYTSDTSANSWIKTYAPDALWNNITCDSTGQYLSATVYNGGIWTSLNYGFNWIPQTQAQYSKWNSIISDNFFNNLLATSNTGLYIFDVSFNDDLSLNPINNSYKVNTNVSDNLSITNNIFVSNIAITTTQSSQYFAQQTTLPTQYKWQSVAISSTGQYIAAVVYAGFIYTSTDYGNTWVQTLAPYGDWQCITSDSTGQYLAAAIYNDKIYTSSNYGSSWLRSSSSPKTTWQSITSNSTGQYLAAVSNGNGIYTSSNYGSNWNQTNQTSYKWTSITSDSTGQYLAAVSNGNGIYTSSNYGSNWNQTNQTSYKWTSITSDSTGQYLAAVNSNGNGNNGYIYTSSNYGSSWTQVASPSKVWQSITSDSTGQYLSVTASNGNIYTSSNYGILWNQQYNISTPSSITSNSTGNFLVATSDSSGVWILSTNELLINGNTIVNGSVNATEFKTPTVDISNNVNVGNNIILNSYTGHVTASNLHSVNNTDVSGNINVVGTITSNTINSINGVSINSSAISNVTTLSTSGNINVGNNITLNSSTGQVSASNLHSVNNTDVSGNINVVGSIRGSAITGTSLSTGSGSITGGAITGTSLTTGSGSITGGSLSTGSGGISCGAITGTSLTTGSGSISGGAISCGAISCGDITANSLTLPLTFTNLSNQTSSNRLSHFFRGTLTVTNPSITSATYIGPCSVAILDSSTYGWPVVTTSLQISGATDASGNTKLGSALMLSPTLTYILASNTVIDFYIIVNGAYPYRVTFTINYCFMY